MPISPRKGESQDDFMARCVPEMIGTGDDKRPQDQAVAACLQIWRDRDKKELTGPIGPTGPCGIKEYADPGYRPDARKRYPLDDADQIRIAWNAIGKEKNQKFYTPEQARRISIRIIAAWKKQIDASGPPTDASAMEALRGQVVLNLRAMAPDPEEDESHDDFIERCTDELGDDMDDDEAEEACQLSWDENSDRSAGEVLHKTHAATVDGMEFILSDATPDRFGDIVDPKGWEIESFLRNPIALFGHDKSFPIGKWANVKISDSDLRGELILAPKGTSPRIDEIRKLVEADILKAVSVGFRPLDHVAINSKDPWGGTHFLKHELVETSLVAVPANPNALAVAKSLGVSPQTVRLVFGEHASDTMRRDFSANRGEHADRKRGATADPPKEGSNATGEHADPPKPGERKEKPMLLSQRIQNAEKNLLALQDNLDAHIGKIDDDNPTEEQMVLTEDFTAKIEAATRNLNNLKAVEARNASSASDPGNGDTKRGHLTASSRPPAGFTFREKKLEPIDYLIRAAVVRCKSKSENVPIDTMRTKVYGDDEITRVMCDMVLKAASAPAETTVPTWAAELVRTVWADFMQVLLPMSVFPRLSSLGLSLTFGANGRIIIPTRSLTPSISGSFVGEGAPIPVRQGAFASQTLTPKKLAVITTWTKEMDDFSIPAIEGLLRQAVMEDTAISLDAILLDNNPATVVRPPGLRSYGSGLTPSAVAGNPFANFVADYKTLYGGLLTATAGNVRTPAIMLNPIQTLAIGLIQPPNAATPLFPFITMTEGGRLLKAALIESSTVAPGMAIMVDAADFTTAGADGPRLEISDQATLHMEDTTPQDITGGTPSPASPVKSMWQTDSLALRMIQRLNWVMRRPLVTWMTGVQWG